MEIIKNSIRIKQLTILGIYREEAREVYYLLKTKRKKNELKVVGKDVFYDFETLKTNIEATAPVLLLIDGKGVLNKTIDINSDADNNWFKNIDVSIMQSTTYIQENIRFLSFCRKEIVDKQIKHLIDHKIPVLAVYIGTLTSILLKNLIPSNTIVANTTLYEFKKEMVVKMSKSVNTEEELQYKIGNEFFSSWDVALYGAAVHFYIQDETLITDENNLIDKEEIYFKNAFNILGKTILIVFFSALLISYLATNFLIGQNNELKKNNVNNDLTHNEIQNLKNNKNERLKILHEMGYTSPHFISHYVYEIVNSVPEKIVLSNLNVFPLKKEIKENKKVEFIFNTIQIACTTKDEHLLNEWMQSIKKMNWVDKFEVLSLKRDKRNTTSFEIKIVLKNV